MKIYKDMWDVTLNGKMVFSVDYETLKEHENWMNILKPKETDATSDKGGPIEQD